LVVCLLLLTFVSAQSAQCTDSDVNSAFPDGKNYYVKSRVSGLSSGVYPLIAPEGTYLSGVEGCIVEKNELHEYYCQDNRLFVEVYICPEGCGDGACALECTDTDGGKNYYVKGTLKGLTTVGQVVEQTDKCFVLGDQVPEGDIGKLGEYYCCFGSGICLETYDCPNGCQDGACIGTIECDADGDCQVAYGEGYTCEDGVCIQESEGVCIDSDGNEHIFKKGTCTDNTGSYTDECTTIYGGRIHEYYCGEQGLCALEFYPPCPEGYICQDGACIQESGGKCTDSDGENYYVKGEVIGHWGCPEEGKPIVTEIDTCEDENTLLEFICNDPGGCDNILGSEVNCIFGCKDGACIKEKRCTNLQDCPARYICQNGICILDKALKIDSPENGAIIDKPTEIIFTIKNTEDRILEFKEAFPFFEDPNGNALKLMVEDMGRRWDLWSTGNIIDGELIELKLNPGESITKTIEFDPYYGPYEPFGFAGNVKILLSHYNRTCTFDYGEERCTLDLGELGSIEINIIIPLTGNVLIERDIGEFKYESSEVEGPFTDTQGWTMKHHVASYTYKDIPVVVAIVRMGSISQANDYLNRQLQGFPKFSLAEINGNEIYFLFGDNNDMLWISGIDVIFIEAKGENLKTEISLDLAKAYLERFPSEIGKEEIEPVCGNGICEKEETNQNCPVDCFDVCRGCVLEGKCYPFGYRKKGEYCSDNYEFVGQLERDSICDNNFECRSNVCVNDKCVSGNLIQRIIEWFKRLFGIE